MNPTVNNILIGSAAAIVSGVVASYAAKKLLEKKPELEPVVVYVGGVLTGAGAVLLVKDFLITKSKAGAILAAG